MFDALIPAIIALPLAGFLFTAAVGRRLGKRAHVVPVGAIVLAWLIGMWVVFNALSGAEPFGEHGYGVTLYTWIPSGVVPRSTFAGLFVDNLTAVPPDRRPDDRPARPRLLDRLHEP